MRHATATRYLPVGCTKVNRIVVSAATVVTVIILPVPPELPARAAVIQGRIIGRTSIEILIIPIIPRTTSCLNVRETKGNEEEVCEEEEVETKKKGNLDGSSIVRSKHACNTSLKGSDLVFSFAYLFCKLFFFFLLFLLRTRVFYFSYTRRRVIFFFLFSLLRVIYRKYFNILRNVSLSTLGSTLIFLVYCWSVLWFLKVHGRTFEQHGGDISRAIAGDYINATIIL